MNERVFRGFAWFALFAFLLVAWWQYEPAQWPAPPSWNSFLKTTHACGPFGLVLSHLMYLCLGPVLSVLIPFSFAVFGWSSLAGWKKKRLARWQGRIFLVALFASAIAELTTGAESGGYMGSFGLGIVGRFIGPVGTTILLGAVGAALLLRFGSPLTRPVWAQGTPVRERVYDAGQSAGQWLLRSTREMRDFLFPRADDYDVEMPTVRRTTAEGEDSVRQGPIDPLVGARQGESSGPSPRIRNVQRSPKPRIVESVGTPDDEFDHEPRIRTRAHADYELPSIELLNEIDTASSEEHSDEELLKLSNILEQKLADFGIRGRVSEVQPGPVITTYEFEPAPGIKVSQVTSRVDDLGMALRAQSIRMVAPIPGKAAIGIEIPNANPNVVGLREILEAWSPDLSVGKLGLALGKTVGGEPFFADLATMPHLLVAGATGAGKSVCINVLLCSLLLRHDPNEVKLLLIDPKMLELNAYRDIPHLLHPVVTEPKDAYKALHWMTMEMERRYRELAKASVRNIVGYNKKIRAGEILDENEQPKEALPYVVVIVDELADLMIQVGGEIETPIARLAQMARAVGIHLVLATQRPSVDVLTGVIKANFPSRISFQVSSRVDSRTILDNNGAEALLGRGDMLFLAGGRPSPIRLHGAFVSVEECERIAEHWRGFGESAGSLDLDEARAPGGMDATSADDELYHAARRLVVQSGVGSVSYLQRRLKVGYSRAARIMDSLEDSGVVGPAVGSKPREVLERPEDLPEPVE